jgi:hypothetical protein
MDVEGMGVGELVLEETSQGNDVMDVDEPDEDASVATDTTGTTDTPDTFPLPFAGRPFLDVWVDLFTRHQTYKTVHPLSRVSRQFTEELGRVLWHNATVEFEEAHTFFLFLKERPAVIPLIRHVVLNLTGASRDAGAWHDTTPVLEAICDFISARMDLSFLTLRLHTFIPDRGRRESAEPQWPTLHTVTVEWSRIFRQVKTRGFNIQLCVQNSRTLERRADMRTRTKMPLMTTKDFKRMLLALWMPDCLR